ncbi:MAG TPA: LytR C-terminal domain-containing protein [Solirubrobacterales bacterium]|nr:LytR C-terminal domain-containing protein [Solirubrobacterales bacterium]
MADAIEQIGSYAGLAAFLGLAVLSLLYFTQARDLRRLRDWAGSAPERDAERKEATSTIAAQRAEELKALEEARTAEHAAISQREQRRKRREEGLPEETRGERLRGFFSRLGERLAEPRWLVVIFIVLVAIVGGVAYTVLSGSDDDAKGKQGKQAAAASKQVKPSEVEVAVLNGTATPGLAATFGDKIEGKGYQLGEVTNSDEPAETSVVMFTTGHKPEAKKVANQLDISEVRMMTTDIKEDSGEASVAVIIGEDDAAETG